MSSQLPFMTPSSGFRFDVTDIPNIDDKVAIVTGANAGLGFETAKLLAVKGATTILACRSKKRCDAAASEIRQAVYPSDSKKAQQKVLALVCDLSSLVSVRDFATRFSQMQVKLDILVLNAGIMHPPFSLSNENIELQFAVNHVAHQFLTLQLIPTMPTMGRVVVVSSNAHFQTYAPGVHLDLANLNDAAQYDPIKAYGQSKLANILFTQELALRHAAGSEKQLVVNCLNPGGVLTELFRHWIDPKLAATVLKYVLWMPETAALNSLYLATSSEVVEKGFSGKYFVPIAQECETSDHATNATLRREVWALTEKLIEAGTSSSSP
jgi:NAD(P)-dependent dehydrogenase (short-subunit alcohol dehydrogenase family)